MHGRRGPEERHQSLPPNQERTCCGEGAGCTTGGGSVAGHVDTPGRHGPVGYMHVLLCSSHWQPFTPPSKHVLQLVPAAVHALFFSSVAANALQSLLHATSAILLQSSRQDDPVKLHPAFTHCSQVTALPSPSHLHMPFRVRPFLSGGFTTQDSLVLSSSQPRLASRDDTGRHEPPPAVGHCFCTYHPTPTAIAVHHIL